MGGGGSDANVKLKKEKKARVAAKTKINLKSNCKVKKGKFRKFS